MNFRKPIRKVSKKRATQLSKYEREKKKYFEQHPTCEFPGCDNANITLHHGAGRTEELVFNPLYFKSLCWAHHSYCEGHPDEAKELGLSFSRLDKVA